MLLNVMSVLYLMKVVIINAYFYYFLIGILLFYIDTIIGLTIPMHFGKIDIIFVPHLTIMYILIMTVYRGFGVAMSLAFFFGIVTDLYFGSIYGLYMFGYIILVVIVDKFLKSFIEIILYYFYHFIIHNVFRSICGYDLWSNRFH